MLSAEGIGRLVILSGPSCVGKSPLAKALGRFHPDLSATLQPIVLYNSRPPRPGERDGEDYHFRSREQIEALRDRERHVVMDVRGDLQALDLEDLSALLNKGDAFFEGNPFIGRTLQMHPIGRVGRCDAGDVDRPCPAETLELVFLQHAEAPGQDEKADRPP